MVKKGKKIKSWLNGFEMELPENGYRYNAVPNVDYKNHGYYEESGINEKERCHVQQLNQLMVMNAPLHLTRSLKMDWMKTAS